jgi:hypothetical protein
MLSIIGQRSAKADVMTFIDDNGAARVEAIGPRAILAATQFDCSTSTDSDNSIVYICGTNLSGPIGYPGANPAGGISFWANPVNPLVDADAFNLTMNDDAGTAPNMHNVQEIIFVLQIDVPSYVGGCPSASCEIAQTGVVYKVGEIDYSNGEIDTINFERTPVPEPSAFLLLCFVCLVIGGRAYHTKAKQRPLTNTRVTIAP